VVSLVLVSAAAAVVVVPLPLWAPPQPAETTATMTTMPSATSGQVFSSRVPFSCAECIDTGSPPNVISRQSSW